MSGAQRGRRLSVWGRVADVWHRTGRARAIAQIPAVALSPTAGPVADQVRLAPPPDVAVVRREAELEQQKQWAHHELHHIEGRAAYVVRHDARAAEQASRAERERAARDHER